MIGPSPISDRVIVAFGRQHIGRTLGGLTGQLFTDIAQGRSPRCDISEFAAKRFYGAGAPHHEI